MFRPRSLTAPRHRKVGSALLLAALISAVTQGTMSAQAFGSDSQTLKIINWVNPGANEAFEKIDAEFEQKYPNIKVQFVTAANTSGPYLTLLETTVDSASADIVTWGSGNTEIQPMPPHPTRSTETLFQYWATHDVFLPLNGQPFLHDYTTAALQSMSYKGSVYGIASGAYQWVVYYNKADFAKYHLSVPHTYAQFISVCKELTAHHLTPLWMGLGGGVSIFARQFLTEPLMAELWQPHVAGDNLGRALDEGTASWDSPYFVRAMTEEATIAKYLEPGYTGESYQGMAGAFATNKAAMLLDGSWDLGPIHQANPKLQIGAFPFPGSNTASLNQPLVAPDLNLEVLNKAHDKDAALKYLAFFSSKPIYQQYVDITGISPTEAGGTYSSVASNVLGNMFGKGLNVSTVFPILFQDEGYYDTNANWPNLQLEVMDGSITPAKAAQLYQSNWKTS